MLPRKETISASILFFNAITVLHCRSADPAFSPTPIELRGIRLTATDSRVLDSRKNIAEAMQFLSDHNFNVVFPGVWNNGATLYRSSVLKQFFRIEIDTSSSYNGRDPLAEVIEEAHKRNIAVIPWFESGLSLQNGNRILKEKPDWAVRDHEGALLVKNGFQWMNALHPEVQQFMSSLVMEVVKNYNVDGIQGGDRMPALPIEGGYDSLTRPCMRMCMAAPHHLSTFVKRIGNTGAQFD